MASVSPLASGKLARAVPPADGDRAVVALGCLLLLADADEAREDAFAGARASDRTLVPGRLAAAVFAGGGGCVIAAVGCLFLPAAASEGPDKISAEVLASFSALIADILEPIAER